MVKENPIGPRLGAHKSIAKSIDLAVDRGLQSTCECLQIFTRPPRRWEAGKQALSPEIIKRFIQKSVAANYYDTAIHMPYLPNLASPDDSLYEKSVRVLIQEVEKMVILKVPYVITHLGSPKNRDEKFAADRIGKALNKARKHMEISTMILLENSTAKRKTWGSKVEHFERIFGNMEEEQFFGICFDTAHAFSSGY
ncbi:MAG: TIM barrel protein, partial [Promethearchaeota archaeon]